MKVVKVFGKTVNDLVGLKRALVAQGFVCLYCSSDENKPNTAYVEVVLDDAETKDPSPVVQAWTDPNFYQTKIPMVAADGTKWLLCIGAGGAVQSVPL